MTNAKQIPFAEMKKMIFSILVTLMASSAHASLTKIPNSKADSFRQAATDAVEDTKLTCHQTGKRDSAAGKKEYLAMLINNQQPLMESQDIYVDSSKANAEVVFQSKNSVEKSTVTLTLSEDRTKILSTKVVIENQRNVNRGKLEDPKFKQEWRTSYTMDCGEAL
jgi:hypothetical protein